MPNIMSNAQGQLGDIDGDKFVALDEASSIRQVVKCISTRKQYIRQTSKETPKKMVVINLRSQGAPRTLGEMQQRLELLRMVDPPAIQKKKTQSKPKRIAVDKNKSMRKKLQNTLLDNTNTNLTSNIWVILPTLGYNIIEDMNKNCGNISLFEFSKIQSQRDILLCALRQTSTNSATSTSKGENTPPRSLSTMLNTIQMDEAKICFPSIPALF